MSTIRIPEVVPSPKEDCETLKKAFVGLSLILCLLLQLGLSVFFFPLDAIISCGCSMMFS